MVRTKSCFGAQQRTKWCAAKSRKTVKNHTFDSKSAILDSENRPVLGAYEKSGIRVFAVFVRTAPAHRMTRKIGYSDERQCDDEALAPSVTLF